MDMFEARLNADEGYAEIIEEWINLIAQFIPKTKGVLSSSEELAGAWATLSGPTAVLHYGLPVRISSLDAGGAY
eukprot:9799310-Karenia_brevis.AAC.1